MNVLLNLSILGTIVFGILSILIIIGAVFYKKIYNDYEIFLIDKAGGWFSVVRWEFLLAFIFCLVTVLTLI